MKRVITLCAAAVIVSAVTAGAQAAPQTATPAVSQAETQQPATATRPDTATATPPASQQAGRGEPIAIDALNGAAPRRGAQCPEMPAGATATAERRRNLEMPPASQRSCHRDDWCAGRPPASADRQTNLATRAGHKVEITGWCPQGSPPGAAARRRHAREVSSVRMIAVCAPASTTGTAGTVEPHRLAQTVRRRRAGTASAFQRRFREQAPVIFRHE
jgi:hypothetical protein